MPNIGLIAFDLVLFYLLFGHSLLRRLYPQRLRRRLVLRDYVRHFEHWLRRDRDLLPAKDREKLEQVVAKGRSALSAGDAESVENRLAGLERQMKSGLPPRHGGWVREYLEVLVVALTLAFGIRGLFLQPFKIPTGSMQPTLYGIHFESTDKPESMSPVKRFFAYLHHSRRYVDIVAAADGYLDLGTLRPVRPAVPLFPRTSLRVGGNRYVLPGAPGTVRRYLMDEYERRHPGVLIRGPEFSFRKGDVVARGYLELGDHLFVDRTRFVFREPRRGDITVFLTDGIRGQDGRSLNGRYYIKRLVGVPGDEIRIRDHRLYVRAAGAAEFELMDAEDDPAFERLYSFQGGYRGYCHHPHSRYLRRDSDTFKLGENEYFMLGDNSENSRDSRFWGVVPRRNLVGTALVAWWPCSRRWGLIDRAEPVPEPTPPTFG